MKINLTNITNTSFSTIKKTRYANTQVATKVSFKSTKSIHEGFTKKEIVDTYRFIECADDKWKEEARNELYLECSLWELLFTNYDDKFNKHLERMELLRKKIKAEQQLQAEKLAKLKKLQQLKKEDELDEKRRKKELVLNNAKIMFNNNFLSSIELEKSGENIEIINGILIEEDDIKLKNRFINYCKNSNQYLFDEISYLDINNAIINNTNTALTYNDIFLELFQKKLKKSLKNYQNNGIRTLIYIPSFEHIGEDKNENKNIIATLKSIMCNCAEKYKSTLLIDIAKNKLEKIDSILLVDSRIQLKIKL